MTLPQHVLRPIWSRLDIRPTGEHFQEFPISILKRSLLTKWLDSELRRGATEGSAQSSGGQIAIVPTTHHRLVGAGRPSCVVKYAHVG